MALNPLKTRKEWQAVKKTYGIPDKVIKSGSFGEKMEKIQKKFVSAGVNKINGHNADALLAAAREADVLLDEWLVGANKKKATDFKNRDGAIKAVEGYKALNKNVRNLCKTALNPIGESKRSWPDFERYWKAAVAAPDDRNKLEEMYRQGIRNYLGLGIHNAFVMRQKLNLSPDVLSRVVEYEQLSAKWHDLNDDPGMLDDDKTRAKFWTDMKAMRKLGKEIIQSSGV